MSEDMREAVEEAVEESQVEEKLENAEGREIPGEVTASQSKHESQASQHGWVSLEEWEEQGKDPDDWVDAKTFNMRGEFFDTIHKQKRELAEMRKAMNDLAQMNQKAREAERQKVLRELREQKKLAIESGDGETVLEVEEEIERVKSVPNPVDETYVKQAEQQAAELMERWTTENPWYANDATLRRNADIIGTELKEQGMSPEEIFEEVPKRIRAEFPHKFENPRRREAAVAESTGQKSRGKSSKPSWKSLSDEQKKVATRFERLGVMSKEDYITELAKSGEL